MPILKCKVCGREFETFGVATRRGIKSHVKNRRPGNAVTCCKTCSRKWIDLKIQRRKKERKKWKKKKEEK